MWSPQKRSSIADTWGHIILWWRLSSTVVHSQSSTTNCQSHQMVPNGLGQWTVLSWEPLLQTLWNSKNSLRDKQLVECLPNILEVLGFNPQHHIYQAWLCMLLIPTLGTWWQEDQKFGVIFGYTVSSRAEPGTQETLSKNFLKEPMIIKLYLPSCFLEMLLFKVKLLVWEYGLVVEHLLSKHNTLGSIHSTTKETVDWLKNGLKYEKRQSLLRCQLRASKMA